MDLHVLLLALPNILTSSQYSSPFIGSKLNNEFNIRSSPLHTTSKLTEPKYLHRLINIKPSSRTHSSDHLCLSLPPVSTKLKFADRSFHNSSPRLWNSQPINLKSFAPDTHTTPSQSSALLPPTLAEHSLFLVISLFRALKPTSSLFPTLHNFSALPFLLAPSRPTSLTSTRHGLTPTSTWEYTIIFGCWFHGDYIKLYFTLLYLRAMLLMLSACTVISDCFSPYFGVLLRRRPFNVYLQRHSHFSLLFSWYCGVANGSG